MLRTLLADLESALSGAKASDLVPRSQGESAVAGRGRGCLLGVAAVSRVSRRPPGVRESRFARLLPGSAAPVRRRRGDDAHLDRALCRIAARNRHPVPSLCKPRHPRPARALRRRCAARTTMSRSSRAWAVPGATPTFTAPWRGDGSSTTSPAAGRRSCPRKAICSGIFVCWSASRFRATRRISRASTTCCSCATAPGRPCTRQVFRRGPGRRPISSTGFPR